MHRKIVFVLVFAALTCQLRFENRSFSVLERRAHSYILNGVYDYIYIFFPHCFEVVCPSCLVILTLTVFGKSILQINLSNRSKY